MADNIKMYNIKIIKSSRKTISIEIRSDCCVLVRAPQSMTSAQIDAFLKEHDGWIRKHLEKAAANRSDEQEAEHLDMDEIRALASKALVVIPEKVRCYAQIMGVTYGRITIRNQKTRWGSCSEKGNLNFNCLLMLMDDAIIDYVVVHELAHRKEMNHSAAFWSIVESVLPDYKDRRKWLKENGARYISMMTEG